MKKWNDKTKKIALVAALIVVGVGAFCGIRFTLLTDKPVEAAAETPKADEDDVNVVVNTEYENLAEQDTEELTISTEPIDSVKTADTDDTAQSIQNDPVKTEDNKPSEAPAEITETEQNGSGEKPENKKIPADKENPSETPSSEVNKEDSTSTPKDGDIKDGKIYFEGFGWIDYNGGGTSGTQANDIYENGNTIGIMD